MAKIKNDVRQGMAMVRGVGARRDRAAREHVACPSREALLRAALFASTALVGVSLANPAAAQTYAAGGGTITVTGGSGASTNNTGANGGFQDSNGPNTRLVINNVTIDNTTGLPSPDAIKVTRSSFSGSGDGFSFTGVNTLVAASGGSGIEFLTAGHAPNNTGANFNGTINATGLNGIVVNTAQNIFQSGTATFNLTAQTLGSGSGLLWTAGATIAGGNDPATVFNATGFQTGANLTAVSGINYTTGSGGTINATGTGVLANVTGSGALTLASGAAITAPIGINATNASGDISITTSGAGTIDSNSAGTGTGVLVSDSGTGHIDLHIGAAIGGTTAFANGVSVTTTNPSTAYVDLHTTAAITASTASASNYGVYISTYNSYANRGTIDIGADVTGGSGVYTQAGVYDYIVRAGATVTAGATNGMGFVSGNSGSTFDNAGTVQATGTGGDALEMYGIASIVNQATGTISGAAKGLSLLNSPTSINNAGTISGGTSAGIYGAMSSNTVNTGTITGNWGIYGTNNPLTLNNSGTITGVIDGINQQAGSARATITNSGTINTTGGAGSAAGIYFLSSSTLFANTVTNSGTIAGGTDATYGYGVSNDAASALTITNQAGGNIGGGSGGIRLSGTGAQTVNLNAGSTTGKIMVDDSGAVTATVAGNLTGNYVGSTGTGAVNWTLASTGSMQGATFGSAGDTFNWQGGSIGGLINAGSGTDTFNAALGAGNSATLNQSNVTGFENYNLTSGTMTLSGSRTSGSGWQITSGASVNLTGTLTFNSGTAGFQVNGNTGLSTVSVAGTGQLTGYIGVYYNAGAQHNFSNAGTITATQDGIFANFFGTGTNSGTITATNSAAVYLAQGSSIFTNSGTITGGNDATTGYGFYGSNGSLTLTNTAGKISGGTGGVAQGSVSGGTNFGGRLTLTNASGAEVSGPTAIAILGSSSLNLTNAGFVAGTAYGVNAAGTGPVKISNSGTIGTGTVTGGVFTVGGAGFAVQALSANITNTGILNSTGASIYQTDTAGTLNLANTGTIGGAARVVDPDDTVVALGTATILNSGTITTPNYYAVSMLKGGTLTNAAGGQINAGNAGDRYGVDVAGGAATINNYGAITSTGNATASGAGTDDAISRGILLTGADAATINLFAGSTTGAILTGSGNDTLALYNGRGTASLGTETSYTDAVSGASSIFILQNSGTLAAASFGAVDLGSGTNTLMLRGIGDGSAANGTAGAFAIPTSTGASILTKADTGTWTLSGAAITPGLAINAGTGGTPGSGGLLIFNGTTGLTGGITVNGGTIRADTAGAFGTGTITTIDPTIQYNATGTYANNISLASTNTITDPTRLEVGQGFTATLTGQITQASAGQPLVFGLISGATSGTIVLANPVNNNNWTGATTIETGTTLRGTTAQISGGSIVDNGVLNYNQNFVGTVNQAISGSGSLLVDGGSSGYVALFNAGTFTGGTTVNAGTLQVGDGGANGSITGPILLQNNALLTFSRTGNPIITSAISGDGRVRLINSTITLNGNITSTGTVDENSAGNVTLGGIRSGATTASDSGYGSGFLLSGTNGALTVASTGQIQGGQYVGVRVTGQGASVTNLGSITNTGAGGSDQVGAGVAIYTVGGTNTVTNGSAMNSTATISGYNNAIDQRGSATTALTINNYGSLTSTAYSTIENSGSAGALTVNNLGTAALIYAPNGANGLNVNAATGLTLNNQGRIVAGGNAVNSAGVVSISNSGLIGAGTLSGGAGLPTYTVGGNRGISANAGGTITNGILGGTIAQNAASRIVGGSEAGIYSSAALTLNNYGSISTAGTGGNDGVTVVGTATVTNTGTITAANASGIAFTGTGSSITNSGATTGGGDVTYGYGLQAAAGSAGVIINQSGGTLAGGHGGIGRLTSGVVTINNSGVIKGTGATSYGINATAGSGTITNNSGGIIAGATNGILSTIAETVVNNGTIGVGTVSAGATPAFTATGTGAAIRLGSGSITNSGTISGGNYAIYLAAATGSSSVTNTSTGVIRTTTAGSYGVYSSHTLALTNSGQITAATLAGNYSPAVFANGANSSVINNATGNITGGRGVELDAGGTIDNYGQITGTTDNALTLFGGGTAINHLGGTLTALGSTGAWGMFAGQNIANNGVTVSTLTNDGTINAGAGIVTISSNATISNTGTITAQDAGVWGYSGPAISVTNTGTITAATGTGVRFSAGGTLVNNGTISAATAIAGIGAFADTVTLGSASTTTGAIALGDGADTLTVMLGATLNGGAIDGGAGTDAFVANGAGTTVIASNVTGFESLTKNGTGTLTLGGTNAGFGTVAINAGTLNVNGGAAIDDTAAVTVASGATFGLLANETIGSLTGAGNVSLGANTLTFGGDNSSTTFSGVASGSGGLTKVGTGVFTISGANTYTGTTLVQAGTLRFGASDVLADTSTLVVLNGATLDLNGFSDTIGTLNLTGTLTGGGTLTALNYNVYGGSTINQGIGGGALNIYGDTTLNSQVTAAPVNIYAGTLTLGAAERLSDTDAVIIAGGAALALGGDETVGSVAGGGNIALGAGTLTTGGDGTSTALSGVISGTGALIKVGAGTFTLSGNNDYSGGTTVSAGTLVSQDTGNGFGAGDLAIASGATAQYDNQNGGTVFVHGSTISGAGTLLFTTAANQVTALGNNGGNVNVALSAGGLIDVEGAGTVLGSTSNQGFWTNNLASLNVGTGATFNGVEGDILVDALTGSGTVFGGYNGQGSTTVGVAGGSGTFDGTIADNGANSVLTLIKTGAGTQTLTGINTYTGTTTISGGTLALAGAGSLAGSAVTDNAVLDVTGASGGGTTIAGLAGSGVVTLGATTLTVAQAGDSNFSGTIDGSGGLTKAGAGTLTLAGANTYAGTTTISGGTLALNGTGSLVNSAVTDNAAFDVSGVTGGATTIVGLSGSGTIALGATTLTVAQAGTSTFSGTIDGSGGLIKAGAGTLTLGGANTYTGATQVNAGTLALGASDVISDSSVLIVASGATFDLGTYSDTVAYAGISGTLAGSGTLTAATYALNGAIVNGNLGAGTLFNTGGTSILNGTAAASQVQVAAGTLQLGASDRLDDAATLSVVSGATLDLQGFNDTVGFAAVYGTLNGTGTLTAGTYELDGATVNGNLGAGYLYTLGFNGRDSVLNGTAAASTVSVQQGSTLRLGASDRLIDSATVNVTGGSTLDLGAFSDTVGSLVLNGSTLNGTGTLTATSYSLTNAVVNANLGTGTLAQAGGTSVLNGTSGAATVYVTGGTLTLGASDRLADTASVVVFPGGTLDLGANSDTVGNLQLSGTLNGTGTLSGSTLAANGATYTLNAGVVNANLGTGILRVVQGASVLSGTAAAETVQITSGSLALGASNRLADNAAVSVSSGAVLDLGANSDTVGTFGLGGTLNGTGTLTASEYDLTGATVNANLGAGNLFQISGTSLLNGTAGSANVMVQGGTLALGASNRLADTATVVVATGTTLDLGANNDTVGLLALNGTLAGTGTLTAAQYQLNGATVNANLGAGTLFQLGGTSVLNGMAVAATVNVNAGTLTLGASNRLADNAAVGVATRATFDLGANNDTVGTLALAGTLAGSGTLTASEYDLMGATVNANLGAGNLFQISGTSLLNGTAGSANVMVQGGTLALGASNRLADTATVVVATGTTLDLGANNDTVGLLALNGTLAGTGTLTAAQYQLNGATVNANLGAGTLFQLGGTSVLNGMAVAATVNVNAGTLTLGASNRLADNAAVGVATGATFDLGANSDTVGTLALAGTLAGSGTLTASEYDLMGATVNANLGAGNLFQISGTSLLNGTAGSANVMVQGGTLALGASERLSDTSVVVVASGATLNLGALAVAAVGAPVAPAMGAAVVSAEPATMAAAGTTDTAAGRPVAQSDPFDGASGPRTMLASDMAVVPVTSLVGTDARHTDTFAAVPATSLGDAGVEHANVFTVEAATPVNETVGILQLNGTLAGNGTLTATQYQLNGATVNANLGTGTLFQLGGTSVLSGTAAVSAVAISAGTLRLGAADRIADAASVNIASGATFDLASYNETVGSLFGTGTLALGGAALTVGGTNTDFGFGGTVTGSGDLTKTGTGTFTLLGSQPMTGRLNVNAGGVLFAGSTAGSARVQGGVLSGGGTFAGNLSLTSGTLSPGVSGQPIAAFQAGSFTATGGSYAVDFAGSTGGYASDMIRVTGAAALSGGSVVPTALEPSANYRISQEYMILQAGTLSGTFGNGSTFAQVNGSSDLYWRLRYDLVPNATLLEVRKVVDFTAGLGAGASGNQAAVGAALNGGILTGSDSWMNALNAISALSGAQRQATYDSIGGEALADITTSVALAGNRFTDMLRGRLSGSAAVNSGDVGAITAVIDGRATGGAIRQAAPTVGSASALAASGTRFNAWLQGYGASGTVGNRFGTARVDDFSAGAAAGLEVQSGAVTVGLAGAVTDVEANVRARLSRNNGTLYQGGGYVAYDDGATFGNVIASYFGGNIDTARSVFIGSTLVGSATGRAGTHGYTFGGSIGHRFAFGDGLFLTPQISGEGVDVTRNAFTESGAGVLSLTAAREKRDLYSAIGELRISHRGVTASGGVVEPYASIGVRANFGDLDTLSAMRFSGAPVGTGAFTIEGARLAKTSALVTGGIDAHPSDDVTIGVEAGSSIAKHERDSRVGLHIKIGF